MTDMPPVMSPPAKTQEARKARKAERKKGPNKPQPLRTDGFTPANSSDKPKLTSGLLSSMTKEVEIPHYESIYFAENDETAQDIKAEIFGKLGFTSKSTPDEVFQGTSLKSSGFLRNQPSYKQKTTPISIEGEEKSLSVKFYPNRNRIELSTPGHKQTISLTFNNEGDLTHINQSHDPFNTMGRILKENGFGKLAAQLSKLPKPNLDYYRLYNKAEEKGLHELPNYTAEARGFQYVGRGEGRTEKLDTPLLTADIHDVGLVIVDKENKTHSLFTAWGGGLDEISEENRKTIAELMHEHSNSSTFYIVTSASLARTESGKPNRAELLFGILQNKHIPLDKINIVPSPEYSDSRNPRAIISLGGNITHAVGETRNSKGEPQTYSIGIEEIKKEQGKD